MADEQVEALIDEANREFDDLVEELGGRREDVKFALDQVRADAAKAIEANDLEHVRALRHEIPAILTKQAIEIRGENRDRAYRLFGQILSALYGIAAKALAPMLLICVLLFGGCAMMKRGTVPSAGVEGLFGEVCKVADHCAEMGWSPVVAACDPSAPEYVENALDGKTITGAEMSSAVADICGAIDGCLPQWTDLQEYRRSSYQRWCNLLEQTAAAALAE